MLTAKQERFVDEYLASLNGTQAAIRAGYSAKTARAIASENLKKPEIAAEITRRVDHRKKRSESQVEMVRKELIKVAFANIGELLSVDGMLKYPKEWPPETSAAVQSFRSVTRYSGRGPNRKVAARQVRVKMHDISSKRLSCYSLILVRFRRLAGSVDPQLFDCRTSRTPGLSSGEPMNSTPAASRFKTGTILVRKSKADQFGDGRLAYLSAEALAYLQFWLRAAVLKAGPIFRGISGTHLMPDALHPYSVVRILKDRASDAGLDQTLVAKLSGHSMRVSAAQGMAAAGIDLGAIMHAGGWKSPDMVMRYIEHMDVQKSGMAKLYKARLNDLSLLNTCPF